MFSAVKERYQTDATRASNEEKLGNSSFPSKTHVNGEFMPEWILVGWPKEQRFTRERDHCRGKHCPMF